MDVDIVLQRRRIEDLMIRYGEQRDWLEYASSINSAVIRGLLGEARAAGITIRDVSRMTGLSTQTLHTWMRSHVRPVPMAHFGRGGPAALSLEEAVLRVIAEVPQRDWTAREALAAIPEEWPSGNEKEVDAALEALARQHLVWDGNDGYRLAPPDRPQAAPENSAGS